VCSSDVHARARACVCVCVCVIRVGRDLAASRATFMGLAAAN